MVHDVEALEQEVLKRVEEKKTIEKELKKHYNRKEAIFKYLSEVEKALEVAKKELELARFHNANEVISKKRIDHKDPVNLLAHAYRLLMMIKDEFPPEEQSVVDVIKSYLIDFCEGRVKRPKDFLNKNIENVNSKLSELCVFTGKISYFDRKFADKHRNELLRKYGKQEDVDTSVYKCKFCKNWHVGRKQAQK